MPTDSESDSYMRFNSWQLKYLLCKRRFNGKGYLKGHLTRVYRDHMSSETMDGYVANTTSAIDVHLPPVKRGENEVNDKVLSNFENSKIHSLKDSIC